MFLTQTKVNSYSLVTYMSVTRRDVLLLLGSGATTALIWKEFIYDKEFTVQYGGEVVEKSPESADKSTFETTSIMDGGLQTPQDISQPSPDNPDSTETNKTQEDNTEEIEPPQEKSSGNNNNSQSDTSQEPPSNTGSSEENPSETDTSLNEPQTKETSEVYGILGYGEGPYGG